MKLSISKEAAEWYKEELHLQEGSTVRFYVRYGGVGGKIPGFSLGIKPDSTKSIHASAEVLGITFYIDENDTWYFEGSDLEIAFDQEKKEPVMKYA